VPRRRATNRPGGSIPRQPPSGKSAVRLLILTCRRHGAIIMSAAPQRFPRRKVIHGKRLHEPITGFLAALDVRCTRRGRTLRPDRSRYTVYCGHKSSLQLSVSVVRIQCRPAGMWHPADPGMPACVHLRRRGGLDCAMIGSGLIVPRTINVVPPGCGILPIRACRHTATVRRVGIPLHHLRRRGGLDCAMVGYRPTASCTINVVPPMRRSSESVYIAPPREDIAAGPFRIHAEYCQQVLPYGSSWDAACVYHVICTS